ncbi:MAG: arginine N-succinyltransferase [Bdellovibrionaceae bacterium]|nr:arginine N-succinyltransferase [Bdellovibrionales bacterium]MCB9254909.1 arginine N-succinyltransferase [Pseudobdellovibrionaceae bacterium]
MEANFLIRSVREEDLEDIFRLSKLVYFINLPADREFLKEKIQLSLDSFSGEIENKFEREYIFVLEDLEKEAIVGTSMIIARHGSPKSPHMYFDLKEIKKYSETLHTGFIHKVLRLKFDHDGPTEIGGLVLDPEYRNHKARLGRQLSFARFLFIKMKRRWFKDRILSELMPPLTESGESILWEAVGRKFTNLSYEEADVLSQTNKEFVTSLFPKRDIFVCLLDGEVRDAIGRVGKETEPVKHMLEKIGFAWKHHIDPFDGGPHFWADTDKITIVRDTKKAHVHSKTLNGSAKDTKSFALVGVMDKGEFRCIQAPFDLRKGGALLPATHQKRLQVEAKDLVYLMPV